MGLFGNSNSVSAVEYDNLKTDFQRVSFIKDLAEAKALCTYNLGRMQWNCGIAGGIITTIGKLIDADMTATAGIVFEHAESELVDAINDCNAAHREIVSFVDGLGTAKQAYLNYLSGEEKPLYDRVNEFNNLNAHGIKMLKHFQGLFS